jgi:uncharacterized protein (TIGR00645 family)
MHIKSEQKKKGIKFYIEWSLFNCRWLLIPFYLKLFWTLVRLLFDFYTGHVTTELLLETLEAIDIVMIANLVKMIITGSYNSFVSKEHGYKNENNSSGILKVKTMTSLMGICAITLLKNFLEADNISVLTIMVQLSVFAFFTIAAWVLAKIDFIHVQSEVMEHSVTHDPKGYSV